MQDIRRRQNRTIVRSLLQGVGFRLASVAAPRTAERWAVDLFSTPPPSPASGFPGAKQFEVLSGGTRLAAWDAGSGPTVLLVHGWGGSSAQMAPLAAALVDAGYHVVAFDQPAHGRSAGRRATLADLEEAVQAVSWRVRPVHAVVAHSLGSTAAALAIAAGAPIGAAVLIAPPLEMPYYVRAFAARLGLPAARADGMLSVIERRVRRDLDSFDLRKIANGQTAPLLVLHDPADAEVPIEHGRGLARAWPSAQLLEMPAAGHRRVLRDARTSAAVLTFLGGLEASARKTA
jgi:pimeloyl-ACP methyl ester carboxylesterase